MKQQQAKRITDGLILALLLGLLSAISPVGLQVERFILDAHSRWSADTQAADDPVIVMLDDVSLDVMAEKLGGLRWPYPREIHAQVLRNLLDAGAEAVAFDILFDLPSGFGAEDDAELAEAIRSGRVYLAAEQSERTSSSVLPELLAAGAIEANSALPVDEDGVLRWTAGSQPFPQTFLEASRYLIGTNWRKPAPVSLPSLGEALASEAAGSDAMKGPATSIPPARGLIPFSTHAVFPRISYFQVHDPELFSRFRDVVKGKRVLVGRTPSASITPEQQADLFYTPVGFLPGVEIHAHHFRAIRSGGVKRVLSGPIVPAVGFFWLLTLFVGFRRLHQPLAALAFTLVFCSVWEGVAFAAFGAGWIVPVLLPISLSLSLFFGNLAVRLLDERDARLITRAQLFHYLPPRVAEHVLDNPAQRAIAADRKTITLLFADVAGFTTLSETESPERILQILQSHLGAMAEEIFRFEGTLDKYLGDGIMAFWGAPEAQEHHATLALCAACGMLKRVEEQNIERRADGLPELVLRIGLHTGEAIVGNIGSELFFDYTAIGDSVNTAARLEGANKVFGTRLLFSEAVAARLSPSDGRAGLLHRPATSLGRIAVKGKAAAIEVFTISAEENETFHARLVDALLLLDTKSIEESRTSLERILVEHPDFQPARFHLEQLIQENTPAYDEHGRAYWVLDAK